MSSPHPLPLHSTTTSLTPPPSSASPATTLRCRRHRHQAPGHASSVQLSVELRSSSRHFTRIASDRLRSRGAQTDYGQLGQRSCRLDFGVNSVPEGTSSSAQLGQHSLGLTTGRLARTWPSS
ncbi:hypothetical protein Droror1_Dr00023538 [Drosera rotundifolia]